MGAAAAVLMGILLASSTTPRAGTVPCYAAIDLCVLSTIDAFEPLVCVDRC